MSAAPLTAAFRMAVALCVAAGPVAARSTDALSPAFDASLENSVTTFDARLTTRGIEPPRRPSARAAMLLADGTVDTDDCTLCVTAACCEVTVASVNPNCCEQTVQSVGQDCCPATTETAECCAGHTVETNDCTFCLGPQCIVWTQTPTQCRPDACSTLAECTVWPCTQQPQYCPGARQATCGHPSPEWPHSLAPAHERRGLPGAALAALRAG